MKEIKFWSVKGKPNYLTLTRFCVFLFKLSFSRARLSLGPGRLASHPVGPKVEGSTVFILKEKQKATAQIFSNPHL